MNFKTISPNAVAPSNTSRVSPTACELSKLAALHPGLNTKKHAQLVLRHNGFSANTANVEQLCESVARMLEIRSERKSQAGTERLQTDAIHARLNNLRKMAVTMAASSGLPGVSATNERSILRLSMG